MSITLHVKEIIMDNYTEKKRDLWDDLKDCVDTLKTVDYKTAREYVKMFCQEEKDEIIGHFQAEFGELPDSNRLKIEILTLLGKLGIVVPKVRNLKENQPCGCDPYPLL